MTLSTRAFGITCGLLLGGGILVLGLMGLIRPGYGEDLLSIFTSVYPGFDNSGSIADLIVGTLYGLADGGIGGFLFAWVYNWFASKESA